MAVFERAYPERGRKSLDLTATRNSVRRDSSSFFSEAMEGHGFTWQRHWLWFSALTILLGLLFAGWEIWLKHEELQIARREMAELTTRVNKAHADVERLKPRVSENREQIGEIKEETQTAEQRLSSEITTNGDRDIERDRRRGDELVAMRVRAEGVDGELKGLRERQDGGARERVAIRGQITELAGRFSKFGVDFGALTQRVSTLGNRLTRQGDQLEGVDEDISELREKFADLNGNLARIDANGEAIEFNTGEIRRLYDLRARLEELRRIMFELRARDGDVQQNRLRLDQLRSEVDGIQNWLNRLPPAAPDAPAQTAPTN